MKTIIKSSIFLFLTTLSLTTVASTNYCNESYITIIPINQLVTVNVTLTQGTPASQVFDLHSSKNIFLTPNSDQKIMGNVSITVEGNPNQLITNFGFMMMNQKNGCQTGLNGGLYINPNYTVTISPKDTLETTNPGMMTVKVQ